MALLCYNKGCGQTFDPSNNKDDSCLFHPGVPIFHDALKGWSCCRKRTTDFSEFLSIKGCTRGRHSNVKPQEPLRPEVSTDKGESKNANCQEIIYQGPKSAEMLQKERPSSDEPMTKLPHKVSASLVQVLAKLDINKTSSSGTKESQTVMHGTRCKNAGCKTIYQGPETDLEVCTHHPGGPVFHEGYKYWSCCCIRTTDFNAFLDQKGCTTGKHRWVPKQDKKKVACRHDWHQTGNTVVITIYAKNALPEFCTIEANRTVLSCQIQFESDKIFKRNFHLWGVIDVKKSAVNLVPSKVEITLRKADQVSWGKLEDPNHKAEPEPVEEAVTEMPEPYNPDWDIADDDISDSDEEWAYDTQENRKAKSKEDQEETKTEETEQNLKRKQVEEEMKNAMREKLRAEEEKKRLEEQRKQEEEGYEDMPDLEDHDADVE
ncbi:Cysteine and histidine-rich domain-containing protein 1 [Oryzias melastigma]|uniref:Cysteine and histidine-rich domain-containing protein 1 n=1 Tax=Oryzias melastigma TaxID=30732 RepID=A0A3B3DTF6_ORYME|nr:cysteine and histidine-rich domain-containing protein 1 [Oryzias melastigma]KAF6728223.1 Cysteine and histidine-rich domain-containing protein 1 [Oryzias melastigma]